MAELSGPYSDQNFFSMDTGKAVSITVSTKENLLARVSWKSRVDLVSCTLDSRILMMLLGFSLHPSTLLLAVYQFEFFILQMSFSHAVS